MIFSFFAFQEFPAHLELRARIQKTLYYGNSLAAAAEPRPRDANEPEVTAQGQGHEFDLEAELETDSLSRLTYDRFSASMTRFCVDRFAAINPDQGAK